MDDREPDGPVVDVLARTAVYGRTARAVEELHQRLEGVAPGDVGAQRHTRWDKP